MTATGGEGVDVVYDSVGKATFYDSIHCLRPRGLCVLFGHASGKIESLNPLDLSEAGSIFFTRPHMAHYIRTREELEGRWTDLTGLGAGRPHRQWRSTACCCSIKRERPTGSWKPASRAVSCCSRSHI